MSELVEHANQSLHEGYLDDLPRVLALATRLINEAGGSIAKDDLLAQLSYLAGWSPETTKRRLFVLSAKVYGPLIAEDRRYTVRNGPPKQVQQEER